MKKLKEYWAVNYLDVSSERLDGQTTRKNAYFRTDWYTAEEALRKTKQLPNVRDIKDPVKVER